MADEVLGETTPTNYGLTTASSETFALIHEWVRICEETHQECKITDKHGAVTEGGFPAARILDLNAEMEDHIKLIDCKSLDPHAAYITLSHVWGAFVPPKLMTSNVRNLQEKIKVSTLPRTFADAIDITRRLDIRYLWIDCLCIIQDDNKDWQRESVKMAQIYERASLNIAATGAQDATGGCYFTRDLRNVKPVVLESDVLGLKDSKSAQFVLYSLSRWRENIDDSLLMHRAWVQQEQFLSKRSLHFTGDQVFWRCLDLHACETYPEGMPEYDADEDEYQIPTITKDDILAFEHIGFGSTDEVAATTPVDTLRSNFKLMQVWGRIVRRYSASDLTYPEKDKLIAIAGLARKCGQAQNYLAGLWKSTLPWQLLWKPTGHRDAVRIAGIPSWSWASLSGQVQLHAGLRYPHKNSKDDLPLIKLIAASTTPSIPESFGPIENSFLEISGYIIKIRTEAVRSLVEDFARRSGKMWGVETWEDKYVTYVQHDLRPTPSETLIYCLAVLQGHQSPVPGNHRVPTVAGLLLQPTGLRRGEYRRSGTFMFPVHFDRLWSQSLYWKPDGNLSPADYIRIDGRNQLEEATFQGEYTRYVISLV